MRILRGLKRTLYSFKAKYNTTVIITVLVLIFSPLNAATSAALADSKTQSGSMFLSVSMPPDNFDDANNLVMNNGAFMSISKLPSMPAAALPVKQAAINPALAARPSNGKVVIVTAYSSTPDQTDDSPFITANGTYVRDGIIATNFLPFGAKVKFPEYSGDKIYTVADRMAKKNSHKIDIWMASRGAALQFGVKRLAFEIVE